MGKKLMLVGPKDSGKTCFAYLLKLKIFDIIHSSENRESYTHRGYEVDVMKKIEQGQWADPTESDDKTKPNILKMECIYPWRWRLYKKALINMPDLSAHTYYTMLETSEKIKKAAKHKEKLKDYQVSESDKEQYNKLVTTIKKSDAYVFFVDTEVVNKNKTANEYEDFYIKILAFMCDKLTKGTKKISKPALVILNKSDSLYSDGNHTQLYGREDDAKDYLANNAKFFLTLLDDTFENDCLSFAFHSPVGKVKQLSAEERYDPNMTVAPDYDFFNTIDAETYTKSFRDFLKRL